MKRSRVLAVGLPLVGVAFGLFVFGLMVAVDYEDGLSFLRYQYPFLYSIALYISNNDSTEVGVAAFCGFCLAVTCFTALRLNKGIKTAVKQGILFFAAPILIVFELGLWHFVPNAMSNHVTNVATWGTASISHVNGQWHIDTFYFLDNSVVLIVASCLFLLGLNLALFKSKGMTNTYRAIFLLESCAALFMLTVALDHSFISKFVSHHVSNSRWSNAD